MRTRVRLARQHTALANRAHHLTRVPLAAALAQVFSISWETKVIASVGMSSIACIGVGYLIIREHTLASMIYNDTQSSALNALIEKQTSALDALSEKQTSALSALAKELTSALNAQNKELIAAMGMLKADASDHKTRTTVLESKLRSMAPAAFVATAPARQMHNLRRFSAASATSARTLAFLARRLV